MSKGKRYTQEFKSEAVKQVTERGYSVHEVAERLGISAKSLYHWRRQIDGKKEALPRSDESVRIARLEAEFKRVTEERYILKNV
ncbi:transposase [Agarivorans sp. B2Z047]|uniref:transposase n=1 Tax=Agarivorans sp. B2Z047 TaxID=2652721 RepID=UPI00128E3866|nr:transposase [Agarivorans sp. B2Z047]